MNYKGQNKRKWGWEVGRNRQRTEETYIINILTEISKDIISKRQEQEVTKEIFKKGVLRN